jgi:hypothetical protein
MFGVLMAFSALRLILFSCRSLKLFHPQPCEGFGGEGEGGLPGLEESVVGLVGGGEEVTVSSLPTLWSGE